MDNDNHYQQDQKDGSGARAKASVGLALCSLVFGFSILLLGLMMALRYRVRSLPGGTPAVVWPSALNWAPYVGTGVLFSLLGIIVFRENRKVFRN